MLMTRQRRSSAANSALNTVWRKTFGTLLPCYITYMDTGFRLPLDVCHCEDFRYRSHDAALRGLRGALFCR